MPFWRHTLICLWAWTHALLTVSSESLFDDDEVAAYKEKQGAAAQGETVGESLFDDDEVAAWKDNQGAGDQPDEEPAANAVTFKSSENPLTNDIAFDERGNIKEGGSTDPDIAYYHVVMINGERFDEPTDGSAKLLELIEKGEDYEVVLEPPSFNQFQCTEKVESMEAVLEQYSHELPEELLKRAADVLAAEGITNSKQLGEVEEKDFDQIMGIPALIKTRLRKVAREAKKQTEVAEGKVEMDGAEVEAEVREYMLARERTKSGDEQAAATSEEKPVGDMEEEDGTFKSLVWAVMNCPTCKGKETIACFRTCRYGGELTGGEKKSWSACLDECIENRWLRATFYAILPSSS